MKLWLVRYTIGLLVYHLWSSYTVVHIAILIMCYSNYGSRCNLITTKPVCEPTDCTSIQSGSYAIVGL